ncbi:MAG TPA: DUF167 family protein [Gammaproteobacteria bacterium]|nr:DUF167 family protein [Gammaproteobacteria bacterium]
MSGSGDWYRWEGDDLVVAVRVQPRAGRDRIDGPHGGRLKVRITAPPVDGKANAHLVRFLAKTFGVAKGAVAVEAGATGRDKRLRIHGPKTLPAEAAIGPK